MRSVARSEPSFPGPVLHDVSSRPSVTTRLGMRKGVGKYDFVARLGSGGMGDVYLAVTHGPHHFRKLCVVKQLRASVPSTTRSRQVFSKEGYLAARLNHPNIVQTYEVGEDNGVPFMAMEYLEGQSMRTLMGATRSTAVLPDFGIWVRIVADALAGLHHAHELRDFDGSELGVIHRDVSPHNIFVTYEGRVTMIDFGAAKLALRKGLVECRTLTGKLGYMAPEYVTGGGIDRRADVFSMGIVLWEALAGRKMPNAGLTPAECCLARPRISVFERRVDPRLDAIVAKATEVDPERRYATAQEMREALEDWLQSSGRAPRQGDLGDLMTAYFEEDKQRVDAAVRQRVEAVPKVHLIGAPSDANLDPSQDESGPPSGNDWLRPSAVMAVEDETSDEPFLLTRASLPPRAPAAQPPPPWRKRAIAAALFALAAGLTTVAAVSELLAR